MSENENLPALADSANLPAWMQGEENVGKATMANEEIAPFLHLVQALSPEVAEETHKQGEYHLRPTGRNLGDGFHCVVVGYAKEFNEWRDRKEGGGLIRRIKPNELDAETLPLTEWTEEEDKKGNRVSVKPVLTETRNFMVLILDETGKEFIPVPAILSFAKSNSKAGKTLLGALKYFKGPICGQLFAIGSKYTENDEGKFYTITVKQEGVLDDKALFMAALETAKGIESLGPITTPDENAAAKTVDPENVA